MRIVFWQNCLSPHQLPYIARLPEQSGVDEVVVVAGEAISRSRKEMGWSVAQYDGLESCKVYVNPHEKLIGAMLAERQQDSWHLFSGIRADRFVFKCLKMSMVYKLHRGIISERPNTYDFRRNIENAKPLWMHRLRFRLQDYHYARHMDVVFGIGHEAVNYFLSVNRHWQVFPFCYCTQAVHVDSISQSEGGVRFVFVGSLSRRKAAGRIIEAMAMKPEITARGGGISIVGDGPLRKQIAQSAQAAHLEKAVRLIGTKPQTEIPSYLAKSDVLILTSVYDGWGAVVNEALQQGCFVIVSDACGAADLPKMEARLGRVFRHGSTRELAEIMDYCSSHIDDIRRDRPFRQQWAADNISGTAIAKYMVECLKQLL